MTAQKALNMLVTLASTSRQAQSPAQIRYLKQVVVDELNTERTDVEQLKAMKTERAELTIRIAELEEELAAAKKPKRRRTTRKKNEPSTDTNMEPSS
tara:strand:+ start:142 stop:432 length:291 start_codon:yes stop_codon:yes gene_type:complete